jgi:hypothetical protein
MNKRDGWVRKLVPSATMLLAAALALHPVALSEPPTGVVVTGVLAVGCFALALLTSEWILSGPGLVLLLSEYAIALVNQRGQIDEVAPIFAVGAFLLMELMDVSLTLGRSEHISPDVIGVRTRQLIIVAAFGGLVSSLILAAGTFVQGSEMILLFTGAACAAMVVLLGVGLAHDVLGDQGPRERD